MTEQVDTTVVAAIDIGASSGRVVAGIVQDGAITIEVVHRFANGMRTVDGHLRWNLSGLYAEVLTGLSELASRYPGVVSIGIDTWAVDYGLLDAEGQLLGEPIAYRDDRTDAVIGHGGRRDQSRAPVRRQRAAVPAVQHDLPARGGAAE